MSSTPMEKTNSDSPAGISLEQFVHTANSAGESPREASIHLDQEDGDNEEPATSILPVPADPPLERTPDDVSEIEARLWYAGVGPGSSGPKLVHRTGPEVFEPPSGPEAYPRLMRLIPVPDSFQFGVAGVTWDHIRDQVVVLLDQRGIRITTVDFVRFTWLKDPNDIESICPINYGDSPPTQPADDSRRYYTNPTIWIGVIPNTLSGAVARESARDIGALLESLQVHGLDIAYREGVYKLLTGHGPALFPPIMDPEAPLKEVIDNISATLSLPIAGFLSSKQGTLGPYFRVGSKLYAITARHNLFDPHQMGYEYLYDAASPKKEVMLMTKDAFVNYLKLVEDKISFVTGAVHSHELSIARYKRQIENNIDVSQSKVMLERKESEIPKFLCKIEKLTQFYDDIKATWSEEKDRIIGFVKWAPPVGVKVAPHGYKCDLCVVELYGARFKHILGNVLSIGLGTPAEMMYQTWVHKRDNIPSDFEYPDGGLLHLRGILSAKLLCNPADLDHAGEPVQRVLKRGATTNTTLGLISRFKSFTRLYSLPQPQDFIETAIIAYPKSDVFFSKGGDSGAIVVSITGEYISMITGGSGHPTAGADITYSTLFEWIWEIVKAKFPDADLYFDDIDEFLANVE